MNLRVLKLERRSRIGTRAIGYYLADEPTKVWPTAQACLRQTSECIEYASEAERAADGWCRLSIDLLAPEDDLAFG